MIQLRNLIRDRRNKLDIWEGPVTKDTDFVYVPLQFWFNKDPGLALQLIALQYHDIVLNVKFKKKRTLGLLLKLQIKQEHLFQKNRIVHLLTMAYYLHYQIQIMLLFNIILMQAIML